MLKSWFGEFDWVLWFGAGLNVLDFCYGFVLWFCAMVLCYGFVLWFCAMDLCYGFVLWFGLVICFCDVV